MPVLIFKLFAIGIGLTLIFYLAGIVLRSARRLNQRVAEFKAEQEELQKQGKTINPYAALAELYAEERAAPPRPRKPRRSSR